MRIALIWELQCPRKNIFSLVIVAGDIIRFVVGNKGLAGGSEELSEKGSLKGTNLFIGLPLKTHFPKGIEQKSFQGEVRTIFL